MNLPSNTIYIIDGNAMTRRAFHVGVNVQMEDLKGNDVKGFYIFARMLYHFLDVTRASRLVVAIDQRGSTAARRRVFSDYKRKDDRDPVEENKYFVQEALAHKLIRALNLPIASYEGYEADDVMATLARKYSARGEFVALVSTDKDLIQCINDNVVMFDPKKLEILDAYAVEEKKGFPPSLSLAVQTLTGDDTDGVPGIKGIGNVTATRLLKQFGSVDNIFKNLDTLTPTLRKKLEAGRERVPITRMLVQLYDNLPIEVEPRSFRVSSIVSEVLLRANLRNILGLFGLLKESVNVS